MKTNYLLNAHPFIPQSFVRDQPQADEDSESDSSLCEGAVDDCEDRGSSSRDLVIPDARGEVQAAFYAVQTGAQYRNSVGRAGAIREPGGKKIAKVRF